MEEYQMDSDTCDEIDSSNVYSDVEPEEIHTKMLIGSYIRGNLLLYASGIEGGSFLSLKSKMFIGTCLRIVFSESDEIRSLL